MIDKLINDRRIVFTDVWEFYKAYIDRFGDEFDWFEIAHKARYISNKHNNDKLCISLLIAVIEDFEKSFKLKHSKKAID